MDEQLWLALVEAVRAFARGTWGDEPVALRLELRHLGSVGRLPLPLVQPPAQGRPPPEARPAPAPAGEEVQETLGESWHSDNWRIVVWRGVRYELSITRAKVVEILWRAWESGRPDVSEQRLLRDADSESGRLQDLFRNTPAWGGLVEAAGGGCYRLAGAGEN